MSLISKITLVTIFLLSLFICNKLQSEELCNNNICVEFNDIQLKISSGYSLIPAFEEYSKYVKYVDKLLVSSFYVKDKRLCLDYCAQPFEGKQFSGEDSSKRLSVFHGNGYSASSWEVEFTSSEGTKITTMGIIYNNDIVLQVLDDKSLWLSLLSQLKVKS